MDTMDTRDDPVGLRQASERVVSDVNEAIMDAKIRMTQLAFNLARANAMVGTAEAVR